MDALGVPALVQSVSLDSLNSNVYHVRLFNNRILFLKEEVLPDNLRVERMNYRGSLVSWISHISSDIEAHVVMTHRAFGLKYWDVMEGYYNA